MCTKQGGGPGVWSPKWVLTLMVLGAITSAPGGAAVLTVNTIGDTEDGLDGLCSLREAITATNTGVPSGGAAGECPGGSAFPAGDSIQFAVAGLIAVDPGLGSLPSLSGGRTQIDGWSAPGALPGRAPRVAIDGSLLGFVNGLTITSPRNVVRGLTIINFVNNGVRIQGVGVDENRLSGNTIGANPNVTTAFPNLNGVSIDGGASKNIIGTNGDGTQDRAERNFISGNTEFGVSITGEGTTLNRVAGNYIGTNRRGTQAVPNGRDGVTLGISADGNIIGTDSSGNVFDGSEGNLISGNTFFGISQSGGGNTIIAGNLIGVRANGTAALPNNTGISISDLVVGVRIGTDGDGVSDRDERNLISGNSSAGITANGQDHLIAGNWIGPDITGTVAIPNLVGISADGGPMTIGGPDERFRNTISGNSNTGVAVLDNGVTVQCNHIGADVNGTAALPNSIGVNVTAGLDTSVLDNVLKFNAIGLASGEPVLAVENNSFAGNTQAGFSWSNPGSQDVFDNWWGDASGPTHPGNPGGIGDEIFESGGGTVFYNPWLLAEPSLCPAP